MVAAGREPSPHRLAAAGSRRSNSPSAASPIVPVTTTRSPGAAPARRTILPCGTAPNAAIEIVTGPGVRTVSPPSNGQPKHSASAPSPRANGASHASPISFGSASVSRNPSGSRALGGKVGQVHPQRLPGDRIGRIIGKEMHAADDAVGGEHEIAARRRRDRCGIVDQPEGAGMLARAA